MTNNTSLIDLSTDPYIDAQIKLIFAQTIHDYYKNKVLDLLLLKYKYYSNIPPHILP